LVGESVTLADFSLATGISVILTSLGEEERKAYPNVTAWYLSLVETDAVIGGKEFPKDSHKALRAKKEHKKEQKKEEPKKEEPKKEEVKKDEN